MSSVAVALNSCFSGTAQLTGTQTAAFHLKDESLRKNMGARGAERVQEFSIQKMVEKTVGLYRLLVARREGR